MILLILIGLAGLVAAGYLIGAWVPMPFRDTHPLVSRLASIGIFVVALGAANAFLFNAWAGGSFPNSPYRAVYLGRMDVAQWVVIAALFVVGLTWPHRVRRPPSQ